MGNTALESTGLGSTQKRIRYCVSGTYICDGIEHITRYSRKKENGNQEYGLPMEHNAKLRLKITVDSNIFLKESILARWASMSQYFDNLINMGHIFLIYKLHC